MSRRSSGVVLKAIAACLLTLGVATPLAALELAGGALEFNAYGTLGLTRSLVGDVRYRDSYASQNFAGNDWTGRLDHRVAAQAIWHVVPEVSLYAQGVARRNGVDELASELSWGYLRWTPNSQFEARVGRFRQVMFLITDSFDVGYAHPWVRPPVELYTLVGEMTSVNGLQLRYRQPVGSYTATLVGHAGISALDRPNYNNRNQQNFGVALSVADADLTIQAAVVKANSKLSIPAFDPTYQAIAQQNPTVAGDYALGYIDDQYYAGLGVRYEKAGWLLMSEVGATRLQRLPLVDRRAWYVTLGRNWGAWTPYVTYAAGRVTSSLVENRLTGMAAQMANALLTRRNTEQTAWSLGVRWDVANNVALKAQVDRVRPETYGLQATTLPAGRTQFDVLSLVMDWAF